MTIPLVDLRAQYGPLESEILGRIQNTLTKMQLFLGENVRELEESFSSFCGARHGIGVGSGTDALVLSLRALGVGPGDEVITVSHTFVATSEAILLVGARPLFVDIDPVTMTMEVSQIEPAITPRTKAIIPVHIYGHPANMDPILDVASRHDLIVIEDACQAHGATYRDQPTGTFGDAACFSFYYSKNLGAYGEAGMIVTNSDEVAEELRILRDHGSSKKYVHESVGYNSRLDEIQAAVLCAKLPSLRKWNDRRRELAQMYTDRLISLPLTTPSEEEWARSVYHLYVIRTQQRDSLLEWLHDRGIMAGIHYPIPVHLQEAYEQYAPTGGLPVTEKVASEILSLPIYPELSDEQLEEVVAGVQSFFSRNGSRKQPSLASRDVAMEGRSA